MWIETNGRYNQRKWNQVKRETFVLRPFFQLCTKKFKPILTYLVTIIYLWLFPIYFEMISVPKLAW